MIIKDFDKYSRHRVIGQVLLPCADINVVKGVHFWKQLEAVQAVSSSLLCMCVCLFKLNIMLEILSVCAVFVMYSLSLAYGSLSSLI